MGKHCISLKGEHAPHMAPVRVNPCIKAVRTLYPGADEYDI